MRLSAPALSWALREAQPYCPSPPSRASPIMPPTLCPWGNEGPWAPDPQLRLAGQPPEPNPVQIITPPLLPWVPYKPAAQLPSRILSRMRAVPPAPEWSAGWAAGWDRHLRIPTGDWTPAKCYSGDKDLAPAQSLSQ